MNNRRQVIRQHASRVKGRKSAITRMRVGNACVAKSDAFFRVANRQPAGAMRFENLRDLDGPMPISIGFDHGHDFDVGARRRS